MSRTLLQLVNDAQDELGITRSNAIVTATDDSTRQLLALANRVGTDLMRGYEWQRLVITNVFQTSAAVSGTANITSGSKVISGFNSTSNLAAGFVVSGPGIPEFSEIVSVDSASQITIDMPATTATNSASMSFSRQDYALPSGHDRLVSDTNWDRTDHWRNAGPKSRQEMAWLKGGSIASPVRYRFMIYRNSVRVYPAPATQLNFSYDYVSSFWVIATGGTQPTKARFSADSDEYIYPDDLMLLGLKWRWYMAKGLDWAAALAEFTNALSQAKATDTPSPSLTRAPSTGVELIGPWSVPDGNWPT